MRYAIVYRNNMVPTPETVARYLPGNYEVTGATPDEIYIAGTDSCGWTLDDYVIPRLGSGLIYCTESFAT